MRKVNSSPCFLTSQNQTLVTPLSQPHISKSSSCSSLSSHHAILHDAPPMEENLVAMVSSPISQYVTCIETVGFPEDVFKNGTNDEKKNLLACLLSPDDPKDNIRNRAPRPIASEIEIEIESNSIQLVSERFNRLLIGIRKQRRATRN
jgi:hypothetical protein